jgi:hypothetical protein
MCLLFQYGIRLSAFGTSGAVVESLASDVVRFGNSSVPTSESLVGNGRCPHDLLWLGVCVYARRHWQITSWFRVGMIIRWHRWTRSCIVRQMCFTGSQFFCKHCDVQSAGMSWTCKLSLGRVGPTFPVLFILKAAITSKQQRLTKRCFLLVHVCWRCQRPLRSLTYYNLDNLLFGKIIWSCLMIDSLVISLSLSFSNPGKIGTGHLDDLLTCF